MRRVFCSLAVFVCAGLLCLCAGGCRKQVQRPAAQGALAGAAEQKAAQPAAAASASAWSGDVRDFSYRGADNSLHKLSEHAGQPIVVNFWAAWCPPCRQEMPDMQKVYAAHPGEFVMLGIASDEREDPLGLFTQNAYSWDFGFDVDGGSIFQVMSIPTTLFIDRRGNIKERFDGMRAAADFEAALKLIL
jgi:thiol-disulfide isomerase/thioredoxin